MTKLSTKTLEVAERYLGVKEDLGVNRGKIVGMFQRFINKIFEGSPWCVCYAIFCVKTAATELGVVSKFPKTASSSGLYKWFKKSNLLLATPVPGCIGMVRGGITGHRHTCIVESVKDGRVSSIDGNYKDSVAHVTRKVSDMDYGMIV